LGHVRYVIDVLPLGSGLFDVRTIEMNAGGRWVDPAQGKTDRFVQYDTRWYRHQAYHRYIQQPL
jgi:hypothetical protein